MFVSVFGYRWRLAVGSHLGWLLKIQEMERKDRKGRKSEASQAETGAEQSRQCGEDKWRLNVEINSFENDTELLHREKKTTWSETEIQQG